MNIEELINELDEIVINAMPLPMTNGKCIINKEEFKDIIQDIRLAIPSEIKQGKNIVADRNEIVAKARKEAEDIIEKAKKDANKLLGENEIMKLATMKATEMITNANAKAKEMKAMANDYSDSVLAQMEESLAKALIELKKTRTSIKTPQKNEPSI